MERKLLSIAEAAAILGVSRMTFNTIRKENHFTEVPVGKRVRFYRDEILAIGSKAHAREKNAPKAPAIRHDVVLNIFSNHTVNMIETSKNVFDLTALSQIDPYGAVSLLCVLVDRARSGHNVQLIVNDGLVCQTLKSLHFFYQIEAHCLGKVSWDRNILVGPTFSETTLLMPIRAVSVKGADRPLSEELITLLRKQGFNDSVGRGIAQIMGELADNVMTHSAQVLSERVCYLAAQRFLYREKNCIIVGLADAGSGIFKTLKSHPKYKDFSDEKALVEAFRPYVTSWDSARGKGLADVLGIAWGNNSYLHVDVGPLALQMDFSNREKPSIKFSAPMASVTGTRFGLILIDTQFERCSREEVGKMLVKIESEL